jgi:hypothetical protein
MKRTPPGILALLAILWSMGAFTFAEERQESFDKQPGWEGHNNRSTAFAKRTIKQDFGFSPTHHARGKATGELGGFINPAAEPAYCAKRIARKTLDDPLTTSGTFLCTGRQFHILIGFFNSNTLNEWRTPNTIALRLYGRGEVFYAHVEYATSRWRAGGDNPTPFPTMRNPDSGRRVPKGFAARVPHRWSLTYDPKGNNGRGVVTATIDEATAICQMAPGHKQDGASFDRCGLMTVMKHWDDGGEVWLDDITINGETEAFDREPGWEQFHNRRTYVSTNVRPRFDFGYSPTHFAGGRGKGELGGLVFRGDCRYPERMAYYADRLNRLTLRQPLKAGGKVALRRGVSDSTTLIGFFHSIRSMKVNDSQTSGIPNDFIGVAIEGPSREGFFFYPLYRFGGNARGHAQGDDLPRILPNGEAHDWTFEYAPSGADGLGKIAVTLGKQSVELPLGQGHRSADASFDRFGIITTWIDGNGQHVYFDDLTYTCKQKGP